jgi:hypothetical protein
MGRYVKERKDNSNFRKNLGTYILIDRNIMIDIEIYSTISAAEKRKKREKLYVTIL